MPCTTILVGKKASNDFSTMIARTDDGHYDVKKLVVVEPKDQPKKYKSVISHVEIELPEEPMRYTCFPSVDLSNGIWPAAGINADPADPGFRHILLRPVPDPRLGHLDAEYHSPAGLIRSAWRYDGDRCTWQFTVPDGTTATVVLPDGSEPRDYAAGSYTLELK